MNRKNISRILTLILIVFMIFAFSYEACAVTRAESPWSSFNQFDGKTANTALQNAVRTPIGFALSLVRTVVVIVAICSLLWAAIRYMAPNFSLFGKVLDQAEVKRDIPRFVIGSVILFGTSGILTFIQYLIEDVFA